MAYKDVREYIDVLERHGELQKIKTEVDWDLEAGAILRRCNEESYPAPFFENVKGYPKGYRLCGGLGGGTKAKPYRRLALMMELDPDTPMNELMDEYLRRRNIHIKPVILPTGPCKENILKGEDADLTKLPAPMIHGGDGGRFMCTWHATIMKDLNSDWVEWGLSRAEILTRKKLGGMLLPFGQLGYIYMGYEKANKPCPFAIAIGVEPGGMMAAFSGVPYFESEPEIAGGFRGEPAELVKCETNDLYVPATSEIVIEGNVMPYERAEEGPFGEFHGYRVSEREERHVYRVECITYRNDPILTFTCMGWPLDESAVCNSFERSANLTKYLKDNGWPVRAAVVPSYAPNCVIVSTAKPYPQVIFEITNAVWSFHSTRKEANKIIFVDETIDPFDIHEVFHDLIMRVHPLRGIRKIEQGPASPIACDLSVHERHFGIGSSVVFDATTPPDWEFPPIEARFRNTLMYPQEIQDRVLSKWEEYGFKER